MSIYIFFMIFAFQEDHDWIAREKLTFKIMLAWMSFGIIFFESFHVSSVIVARIIQGWLCCIDGLSGKEHYDDVIMGAMASQNTSLTIVYSTVYSGTDQRKHQISSSLAFVRGNSPHKWPVTDDVIMETGQMGPGFGICGQIFLFPFPIIEKNVSDEKVVPNLYLWNPRKWFCTYMTPRYCRPGLTKFF